MKWTASIVLGVCAATAGLLGHPGMAAWLFLFAGGFAIDAYMEGRS